MGGEKLENHFVSKYDASGHLIRREIRQGPKDELVYTEEFQYNGSPATVERRIVTPEGGTKFPTKYRLDADGNVVELWSHQGYHVSWKYDGQNRVVEQLTDAYSVPSACDDCPLPGAIRTRYEDHRREQTFFEPGGKAVLQRVIVMEKARIYRLHPISTTRSRRTTGCPGSVPRGGFNRPSGRRTLCLHRLG